MWCLPASATCAPCVRCRAMRAQPSRWSSRPNLPRASADAGGRRAEIARDQKIMEKIRRILVVGGGVGGLTAATAFAQRGVEAVLIERRAAFDAPGVGLGQPANALRVYDAIGVLPEILSSGFSYDHMYIFDPNRELIVDHKF